MKLVFLFLLVTIPICCYAGGSGCDILDEVIRSTTNSSVSSQDYLKLLQQYVHDPFTKKAVENFKQCFLDQSQENQDNASKMMEIIFNSESCQQSS